MTKYTHAEIAADLGLWNEYFNTSGTMTDAEWEAMSHEDLVKMLDDCFPESAE